jgi:hypothetical protein
VSILLGAIEKKFGSRYTISADESHAIFIHGDCGDKRGHLYVNVDTGGWFCQRCEAAGWVEVDGWVPRKGDKKSNLRPFDEYQPIDIRNDPRAVHYLWSRGVQESNWNDLGFSLSAVERYRGLILCPIFTGGEYQGWQGRVFLPREAQTALIEGYERNLPDDQEAAAKARKYYWPLVAKDPDNRWFSCVGFRRATAVFNYDRVFGEKSIVLCEGIFSSLAVENRGVRSIATLGKSVSALQMRKIFELARAPGFQEFVLAIDGDAYFTSLLLGYKFSEVGIRCRIVSFENKKVVGGVTIPAEDPASVPDIERRVKEARPWKMIDLIEEMQRIAKLPRKIRFERSTYTRSLSKRRKEDR